MKQIFKEKWDWVKSFFLIDEGGKKVLHTKRLKYISSSIVGAIILTQILMTKDDSVLGKSQKGFESGDKPYGLVTNDQGVSIVNAHNKEAQTQVQASKGHQIKPVKLTYNGRQVFERQESQGLLSPIPSGTNFIGKLVTGIDTRQDNQTIKVILPYGGSHPAGGKIPKDSIILGSVSFSGGDRVYLRLNRIIFPNGTEYKIDAQGLSSSDYTPGLMGINHSETDLRVAGAIGLSLISAGADVMTQRTALGGNPYGMAVAQPDATFKNAGLQGVSQVTKQEAERVGSEMQEKEEYLTVQTGGDLIVSLLTPFKGESL